MSIWRSSGSAQVTAQEIHTFVRKKNEAGNGTSRLAIWSHGRTAGGGQLNPALANMFRTMIRPLALRGYIIVSCDWRIGTGAANNGQSNWGNDNSIGALNSAITYAQTARPAGLGAASGRALFMGWSMGNVHIFNYAQAFPDKVAGLVGLQPGSDVEHHFASGLTTEINAAYGGSWDTNGRNCPNHGDHNPQDFAAAELAPLNIPYRAYYSDGDATVPAATVTALAAEMGGSAVSLGTFAHGDDAAFANVPTTSFLNFVEAARW